VGPKCVVIALAWLAVQAAAGGQPEPATGPGSTGITEEVLVRGTRLRELRAAIVQAEDRFYARYNELNKVDRFDIECAMDAHTGTLIKQRRCFTKLQLEARSQNGREVLQMFQEQAAGLTGTPPNTDPEAVWLAHYDDYRDNMLYLLKVHPELRRLARDRDDAQKRYDTEYRRRLKGRLILRD